MSKPYGLRPPPKTFVSGGLDSIPAGAHMIPTEEKGRYESIPFHVYHPTSNDAVTILRSRTNPHDWLVCGWYIDTFRQSGHVKGLLYRQVSSDADKEAVLAELKKHDKEALARFAL